MVLGACSRENPDTSWKPAPEPDLPVPEEFADYIPLPVPEDTTRVQPMTGIVLWTDNPRNTSSAIQLEYSYMRYCDICVQQGVYNWAPVDNLLAEVAARGHQAILRFYYTYVGEECAVPAYIKALPDYEETVGKSEGERTCFPDWRCPELRRFHLEFYQKFAGRYDSDSRLAFLETGFGLWAEYHIYDGPYIAGRTFPSAEFQAEWLRKMDGWFLHTPWCISIDAAEYGPFEDDRDLLECSFGNFDDSFMCDEHDRYNAVNWQFFGKERYRRAPLGGEFSYYTTKDQKHCLDATGIHGRTFEAEAARFHLTFIIGNDQPDYQKMSRIESAGMATGYRFRARQFLMKEGTGAAVLVENSGIAPIYRDAFLAVDGVRSEFNLRTLMPGEQAWIPVEYPSVSASATLTVECDHLLPNQRIGIGC